MECEIPDHNFGEVRFDNDDDSTYPRLCPCIEKTKKKVLLLEYPTKQMMRETGMELLLETNAVTSDLRSFGPIVGGVFVCVFGKTFNPFSIPFVESSQKRNI
uniref:Uncharacterized protein n=1 Tax=Glossina austeni TaxID=7395 RepID=A0A1A9VKZ2_GLOAU